jgi:hypothetical protein
MTAHSRLHLSVIPLGGGLHNLHNHATLRRQLTPNHSPPTHTPFRAPSSRVLRKLPLASKDGRVGCVSPDGAHGGGRLPSSRLSTSTGVLQVTNQGLRAVSSLPYGSRLATQGGCCGVEAERT